MSDKKIIRVCDVMKPKFDVIEGMLTIAEALKTMKHIETKCLIIDKRNSDDEYGMLLISDIARRVLSMDRAPARVNVYEVMVKPVVCVTPDMDIRYCARLFTHMEISRCPVKNDAGQVVGIVSLNDLVQKGLMSNL